MLTLGFLGGVICGAFNNIPFKLLFIKFLDLLKASI